MNIMEIPKEKLLFLFRKMIEARRLEEKIKELTLKGEIPLPVHLGIGEEAIGVGMVACLRRDDFLKIHFRGCAHLLTWGADMNKLVAGWFIKETGYSRGRDFGDSGWGLVNKEGSIVASDYILGAGFGIACGFALTSKIKGEDTVTICHFGDGVAGEGGFHEGMNLAAIWKLPVIFVCENNQMAAYTSLKEEHSVENLVDRAAGYNMPGVIVEGNDVLAVYKAVDEAVQHARKGKGPFFIECKTYRMAGHHCPDDDPKLELRKTEIEEWRKKDPIQLFKKKLISMEVLTPEVAEMIDNNVKEKVKEAMRFALSSPEPDATREEALKYIWS